MGESCRGHKQRADGWKEKDGKLDNRRAAPVDSPELEVNGGACWRSISGLLCLLRHRLQGG